MRASPFTLEIIPTEPMSSLTAAPAGMALTVNRAKRAKLIRSRFALAIVCIPSLSKGGRVGYIRRACRDHRENDSKYAIPRKRHASMVDHRTLQILDRSCSSDVWGEESINCSDSTRQVAWARILGYCRHKDHGIIHAMWHRIATLLPQL